MAGKKSKNEIDGLRAEIRALSEAVWALRNQVSFEAAAAAANGHAPGKSTAMPAADLLNGTGPGVVTARGVIRPSSAPEAEISWEHEVPVVDLLDRGTEDPARVLAAIGQAQRLAIAKVLLEGPSTAATLVTTLDLGTTGAAYHHLNVLQSAGLVWQASRGVFELVPERVGTILTILAALSTTSVPTTPGEPDTEPEMDAPKKRKKSS